MNQACSDPLVSCPIVTGEYMRASGFFYSHNSTTYLITARHNVLPTDASELYSGGINLHYETHDLLPEIDVFLRTDRGFDVERIDIRDVDRVIETGKIDMIAVPFPETPEEYGYYIWGESDVISPKDSIESLDIIGYNGGCFPHSDTDYEPETYTKQINGPVSLPVVNEVNDGKFLAKSGALSVTINEEFVGSDEEYQGLSGSPVLGDGLLGMHMANWMPPEEAINQLGGDESMMTIYTRSKILPKLLD